MGFISKSYLQTQFTNFATRLSLVFAKKTEIPSKFTDLENDGQYMVDLIEMGKGSPTGNRSRLLAAEGANPTVRIPSESGTLALKSEVPTKVSQLANDCNYVELQEGLIPTSYLPSYIDDVLECYYDEENDKMYPAGVDNGGNPVTGEKNKIYVDINNNKTYRWSGTNYVVISETIALGENSSTAYRGDRGKTAYEHSQAAHAPSDAQKNVQSDWNATSGDALIKNKPSIPTQDTGNIDFSTYFS